MKKYCLTNLLLVFLYVIQGNSQINWTSQNGLEPNNWNSITYGEGLFVAVAASGNGNRIMTSPDGVNWTLRTPLAETEDYEWRAVTYGNERFVALGFGSAMTSDNGTSWLRRPLINGNQYSAVTYGNGKYVAVAFSGINNTSGQRAMYSNDGIDWTLGSTPKNDTLIPPDSQWQSITYGNGTFVAVGYPTIASSSLEERIMTSTDGIVWTGRTAPTNANWNAVTFGNGLFVAVASSGSGGGGVMTSPDGITWTYRTPAENINWESITYGNNTFVAVASSGTGQRIMTSPDGINWTRRNSPADNDWQSVTYGGGTFVAVSNNGTATNRVMISQDFILEVASPEKGITSIYPNPASDLLKVRSEKHLQLRRVNVYNNIGQMVKTAKQSTLSIFGLEKGIYYVEVISDLRTSVKPIIVE